jgi:spore germination protein GerM
MLIFMLWPSVKRTWSDFSENRNQPAKPTEKPAAERPLTEKPPLERPVDTEPQTPRQERPVEEPQTPAVPPPETETRPPVQPEAETRDRGIYLMLLDRDGNIVRPVRVNRKLRVSTSPLQDSLNALFAGPTAEEKRAGMDSFIPQNSRILSVRIEGNTALISFNEEFQFNSFGREGCEAQLKQIVWTATEFPNIHNVQILINGKKIDFLSEGIRVTDPIGR